MAGMTTDTTVLAADPVTNEVLAGKVVEAVKAVQDAEETVVHEGKRLTAHMADPTAHGIDITECIGQAISDHNGDDTAHGLGAFKTDLDVPTLVRTNNPALSDARTPTAHHHQASEIEGIPDGAVGAEQLATAITTHNNDATAHGGSGQALITAHNADAKAHGIGTTGSPLMTSIVETVQAFADDFIAGGEGCITIKGQVSAIKDIAAQYANAAPGVEVEPGKVGVQTYAKKADDFANAAPQIQVETGKYSSRHWAEEARARADAASAVSGLPAFGLEDVRKAIVVNEDASGWSLGEAVSSPDWGDVIGKPGTFPPASHTHAAADVGNIDAAKITTGTLPVTRGGTGNTTGNAATAGKLVTARTIALTGGVTGSTTFDGSADISITTSLAGGIFKGMIMPFYGTLNGKNPVNPVTNTADTHWHVCDGTDGTPDMRDRFVVGTSGTKANKTTGGSETANLGGTSITIGPTTLTEKQIAVHKHLSTKYVNKDGSSGGAVYMRASIINDGGVSGTPTYTANSGGGGTHTHGASISNQSSISNLPPYIALYYIMNIG